MLKGLRVVRSRNWSQGGKDGGEGRVGTLEKLPSAENESVGVYWDVGLTHDLSPNDEGLYELLIFDSAPAGISHEFACDQCKRKICGALWQCFVCYDVRLCTPCYMENMDVDSALHAQGLQHDFIRFDNPFASGVGVGPRQGSLRLLAHGFAKGALVAPRVKTALDVSCCGEIVRGAGMRGFSDRSLAQVRWENHPDPRLAKQMRLVGHAGDVDLKAIREAELWHYFVEHLPCLGSANYMPMESILVKNLGAENLAVVQQRATLAKGDIVRIAIKDVTSLYEVQMHPASGGWNPKMKQCFDEHDFGLVQGLTPVGAVCVQFRSRLGQLNFHPYVLEKFERPEPQSTPFEKRRYKAIYLDDKLKVIDCPKMMGMILAKQKALVTKDHLEAAGKSVVVRLLCRVSGELVVEVCDDGGAPKPFLLLFAQCIEGMPNTLFGKASKNALVDAQPPIHLPESTPDPVGLQKYNPRYNAPLPWRGKSKQVEAVEYSPEKVSESMHSSLVAYSNSSSLASDATRETLVSVRSSSSTPTPEGIAHEKPSEASGGGDADSAITCAFCNVLDAMIQFKPCGHAVLCGICTHSFRGNKCFQCGVAITGKFDLITHLPYDSAAYVEEKEDPELCPICFAKRMNCSYNCGHRSCYDCFKKLEPKNCHSCRAPITKITLNYC